MNAAIPAKHLNVHLLPDLAHPHEMAGQVLVVIDILRASTTLAAAVAAGTRLIVPCLEVDEARQLARQRRAAGPVLLGGERGGRLIEGFDLGNSPAEYEAAVVGGTTLVFTTTNGTRAMMRCIGAGRVLIGCFANLSALARQLRSVPRIELICAGTQGQVSWEDTLFAGALVDQLGVGNAQLNDAALVALQAWREIGGFQASWEGLTEALRQGLGGRNLIEIGRAHDISWAAKLDRFEVVPELSLADWAIRSSSLLDGDDGPV